MKIDFTLVVSNTDSFIKDVHVREYESQERDPDQARRLAVLASAMRPSLNSAVIKIGQAVPNFTLVDQNNHTVALSQFDGKVVAMTFIHTRCPLPDHCLRLSNNFGQLQRRFAGRL